jgi:hypothetical protein
MGRQALEEDRLITVGVQRRRVLCCHSVAARRRVSAPRTTKALLWRGFAEMGRTEYYANQQLELSGSAIAI